MIVSHRGRKTDKRENTIEAFEKAFHMGAEGIEADLRLTADKNVIVYHDRYISTRGKKTRISRNNFEDILSFSDEKVLTLEELFSFIKKSKYPFFLELKSSSPILVRKVADNIDRDNLWGRVHVIGFSIIIRTALKMQEQYPKLRVIPFLNLPILSFVRPPKKSYGIFMGWIDEWRLSEGAFRKMLPPKRLEKLKRIYEKNGFKVMAGVINSERGMKYFKDAGITDIVTDEIELAARVLK